MTIAMNIRRASVILCLAALAGCRGGGLVDLLDEDSVRRLDAVPEGATLLVSLSAGAEPVFNEGIRLVQRDDAALLVEATRESLARFAELPDVTHVAVWGPGDVLRKLDPELRGELLRALAGDAPVPLPIIATFAPGAPDAEAAVTACGATLRSFTSGVATLDADPDAALRLLEMPSLVELERPTTMRPLEGR